MADAQPSPQQILERVRNELQTQMMQDLMNKITDNCFTVCTGKRGDGLDSTEKNCLHNCMNRYMDTMGVVNKTLQERQGSQ